jgi:hypothetical protein
MLPAARTSGAWLRAASSPSRTPRLGDPGRPVGGVACARPGIGEVLRDPDARLDWGHRSPRGALLMPGGGWPGSDRGG